MNTRTMIQFRQSSKTCKTNNILFDIINIYGKMIKKSKDIEKQNSGHSLPLNDGGKGKGLGKG